MIRCEDLLVVGEVERTRDELHITRADDRLGLDTGEHYPIEWESHQHEDNYRTQSNQEAVEAVACVETHQLPLDADTQAPACECKRSKN